jgi:hypothetical protein
MTILRDHVANSSLRYKSRGCDDVRNREPNIVTPTFFLKSGTNVCEQKCFLFANISTTCHRIFGIYEKICSDVSFMVLIDAKVKNYDDLRRLYGTVTTRSYAT